MALTPLERGVLDLEAKFWRYAGAKEAAMREQLDLSPARYYQLLNGLIDRVDALEANPVLVNRLRRRREAAATARSARMALPR